MGYVSLMPSCGARNMQEPMVLAILTSALLEGAVVEKWISSLVGDASFRGVVYTAWFE
jgi:hypothetical protein